MKKQPAKSKRKKIGNCPKCKSAVETVWMNDGSTRAVEPARVEMIFTNYAMASGRYQSVWKEHVCPSE